MKQLLDDLNFDDWKLLFNTCNEKQGGNVIWLAKERKKKILQTPKPILDRCV
jgi:hypothetical protein